MTITCPHCQQQHALYWLRWGDNTKHLYYRCNKVPVILNQHHTTKAPKMRLYSRQFMVDDFAIIHRARKDKEIPEIWNKSKIRKHEEEMQMQMMLI